MTEPNFLVLGAQKCGTTWLEKMLKQHPDVFAPDEKELHFFNNRERFARGMDWYRAQFAGWNGQKAVGEFTPGYYWVRATDEELREYGRPRDIHLLVRDALPDARFILMLRDPVARAVSAYFHHVRKRRFSPREPFRRARERFGLTSMGFYHRNLVEWMKVFPKERFLVLIFEEDVVPGSEEPVQRVYRHLGIDDAFRPTNLREKHNRRESGTYLHLNYFLGRAGRALAKAIPPLRAMDVPSIAIPAEDLRELHDLYADENRKLEELLGRELPAWRPRS